MLNDKGRVFETGYYRTLYLRVYDALPVCYIRPNGKVSTGCLTVLLADYMSDDTALKEGCGQGLIEGMVYSLH